MFANCLRLSPAILSQFIPEVCAKAEDHKNNRSPYFGSSRSFTVIDVNTTENLVTSACCESSMLMPMCNRFHAILANSGKMMTFKGYRSLMPSCAGFFEHRRSRLEH